MVYGFNVWFCSGWFGLFCLWFVVFGCFRNVGLLRRLGLLISVGYCLVVIYCLVVVVTIIVVLFDCFYGLCW